MKTIPKTKSIPRKNKSSKRSSAKSVALVHAKRPLLRHLRLVSHAHTGSLIHVSHSSHIALAGILVFVGFFLFISQNLTTATPITASGTVSVGLVVNAPPPTGGATITAPVSGVTIVNLNPIVVSGICVANSFVVVYNDGALSSSTICSGSGTFALTAQLHIGQNILTARNFDNLNQAGPDTPSVTVTLEDQDVLPETPQPTLPDNPAIIPGIGGISECDDYKASDTLLTGGEPRIAVVCVPRTVAANQDNSIGILVWGGQPPYAINFKWGSGDTTLISMDAPGYRAVKVRYASSGVYNININLTDRNTRAATGDSAIEVSGTLADETLTQVLNRIVNTSWFETPVPLYVIAVALTLGFWGGDIFQRLTKSARKPTRPTRKASR